MRIRTFCSVLHAMGQYQTNEVLLWGRPDSCLLNALSVYQGNTDRYPGALGVNLCVVFLASALLPRWIRSDPICISLHVLLACRPARRLPVCLGCYSQSASYPADYILAGCHRSKRTTCNAEVSQASELFLWDRPDSCFLSCFTSLGLISD